MRDGRFFHAVWLCSVCILPAGRRMWDTLFSHGEAFRALAAATDGSAKRRRAVSQTEGRDWWPPCFTVRYGGRSGTFAFVGVVSCRLGEIRHLGRHPFRMFADTSSGRDIEMLSQSRCPKCGRQAVRQQTGAGVFAEAGGWSSRWARKQETQKGRALAGSPLVFSLWMGAYWAGTASGGMGAPCSGPAGRVCTAGASCTGSAGCAFSAGAGVPSAGAGAAASSAGAACVSAGAAASVAGAVASGVSGA